MSKPKTVWQGQSPFKKAPRKMKIVNVSSLVITNDPVPACRASVSAKYAELFAKLKPGQSIKCQPDEAGKIGHALNKWLEKHGKKGAVKTCRRYEADGLGRVWLLKGGAA